MVGVDLFDAVKAYEMPTRREASRIVYFGNIVLADRVLEVSCCRT